MSTTISAIAFLYLFSLNSDVFTSAYPKAMNPPSPVCIRKCRSCNPDPVCAPGVSLVQDDCGCCKVCARQIGESCDRNLKCDPHKNLYCTYSDVDTEERRCAVMPGRSCYSADRTYGNGESFHLGCKAICTCTNGYIGCFPRCPTTRSATPPTDCLHPRLVKKPGQCCEEWVCAGDRFNNTTSLGRNRRVLSRESKASNRRQVVRYTPLTHKAAAKRPEPIQIKVRARDKCRVQTTEWSPCSATCGWGVSDRVVTDKSCKLRKQSRLCQLRPCKPGLVVNRKKKGKRCTRTTKSQRRVRFTYSGCQSKSYTPKYCGSCVDGRCCTPKRTATKSIKFICGDSYQFRKRMMIIKSCECRRSCASSTNDILLPFRRIGHDTLRE